MDDFSTEVWLWWWGMAAIGLLSLVLWAVSAWSVLRRSEPAQAILRYRRWQLLLSAGCVLGCASGSFVLWADVQRLSSIDGLSANVLVGRTIATVAEVMFVAQWALLLGFLSRRAGSGSGLVLSRALVLLILAAETCSWYAVLTTNDLGNALAGSIQAATVALLMLGLVALYRSAEAPLRRFLQLALGLGVACVLFLATVDVPMSLSRWWADQAAGRTYPSLSEGLSDAMRRTVGGRWAGWRDEILWMSLYFSSAAWVSLALIHLPRLPEETRGRRG
ncbi:MAG TPA: hypothetical protein ENK18_26535 [Deltaproteobacteria bacterium]|nr:hypothetical protein [Deltaproteobacteria bacterium]